MSRTACLLTSISLFLCTTASVAADDKIALDFIVGGDGTFYERLPSGAMIRLNLIGPNVDPNVDQQRFRDVNDPSVVFGNPNFDGFPNDDFFHLGTLSFDGSGLGGNGVAPITALNLGVQFDPDDPSYININRFPTDVTVDSFSGTVTLVGGEPTTVTLNSDVTLSAEVLGSPPLDFAGTFNISGTDFTLQAAGTHQDVSTLFGLRDVDLEWDFDGTFEDLSVVPEPSTATLLMLGVMLAVGGWRLRRRGC